MVEHLDTSNEGKGEVVSVHTVQTHATMEVQFYMFLKVILHGGEGHLPALGTIPKGKELLFSIVQMAG